MSKKNIVSYIGLALFTAYSIFYYIDPSTTDLVTIFACLISLGILPIFLLISCGTIIYSIVEAIRKRIPSYIVTAIWSLALLLFWALTPNLPPSHLDAYEQEKIYEKKKDELWNYAHQIDNICLNDSVVSFSVWKNSIDQELNHVSKLSTEDVKQIRNILNDLNYTNLEYYDSICTFGIRHQGWDLYSFALALHGKQVNEDYETIIYNDSVAFVHRCGAIGSCSYPGKKEYLKSKGRTSEY